MSYCNEADVKMLKECVTTALVGILDKNVNAENLGEVDIRKAFASAGCCVKYIPRFIEFDVVNPILLTATPKQLHSLT